MVRKVVAGMVRTVVGRICTRVVGGTVRTV